MFSVTVAENVVNISSPFNRENRHSDAVLIWQNYKMHATRKNSYYLFWNAITFHLFNVIIPPEHADNNVYVTQEIQ